MSSWVSGDGISWDYYPVARMWFGKLDVDGETITTECTVAEFRHSYPGAPPEEGRMRIWASLPQRGLIWWLTEPHRWQGRHPL